MNTFKVTHVGKDDYSTDITAIGVKKVPGVEGWRPSISDAISRIESGKEGFYVLLPQRAEIIVKQGT